MITIKVEHLLPENSSDSYILLHPGAFVIVSKEYIGRSILNTKLFILKTQSYEIILGSPLILLLATASQPNSFLISDSNIIHPGSDLRLTMHFYDIVENWTPLREMEI